MKKFNDRFTQMARKQGCAQARRGLHLLRFLPAQLSCAIRLQAAGASSTPVLTICASLTVLLCGRRRQEIDKKYKLLRPGFCALAVSGALLTLRLMRV
jgi:hypothetical protein